MTGVPMSVAGAAAIAALVLCSCGKSGLADGVVAEAYGEQLFQSDLRSMVTPGTSTEDSAALAQRFIDNWLRERVLLHTAELNLSETQKDVDRQLREYRTSLITYTYEQALVRQKLDTVITDKDIMEFYEANTKNFELKDNIVRVRWFKLREDDKRVLRKVDELWRSDKPEDRHQLEVFIVQRGSTIYDTHDDWMPFKELQQQVPLRPDNPTDWLERHDRAVVSDSVGTYYLEFMEHRLKNSISPPDLVRADIRAIIINQRKLKLLERMCEDLFKEALANKDVIIH
jgi:hypothetical protein